MGGKTAWNKILALNFYRRLKARRSISRYPLSLLMGEEVHQQHQCSNFASLGKEDLVDLTAWLTSELWSSEFRIMVSQGGPAGFYNEIGVVTDYDDIEHCCVELIINSN